MTAPAATDRVPRPGMLAEARNRQGVVAAVEPYDKSAAGPLHLVHLEYLDDHSPAAERLLWEVEPHARVLEPHALPDPAAAPMRPAEFDAFLRAARWTALTPYLDPDGDGPLERKPPASPLHGGVRIEDYQLTPLFKALRMPRVNLLIADDVGLGKTVEAGLILQELLLRRRLRRVLILTPASLRNQWREEMRDKFALRFEIVDRPATARLRRTLGMDANPWRSFDRIVASYHYLRGRDIEEQFRSAARVPEGSARLPWDLLIVDECHNLLPAPFGEDSDLSRMLARIAPLFEHRLFLSATPHNGHTRSFTGLLEMLDPVRFHRTSELGDAMRKRTREVVVRRLKRQVETAAGKPRFARRRPPEALHLPDEPLEAALADAFADFRRRVGELTAKERKTRRAGHFAVEVLGKRLLSCPTAFAESWRRARAGLEGAETAAESEVAAAERSLRRETGDDRETERREATAAGVVGAWLQKFAEPLAGEIDRLHETLAALGFDLEENAPPTTEQTPKADTRFDALVTLIEERLHADGEFRNDERLIVFTEYKTTLDTLTRRLRERYPDDRILTLFGAGGVEGMGDPDREAVKAAFNDPGAPVRILVATDAASEGLNLHRTARILLHYDCPWNPSRLEQRNGRLDRYGQGREVTVLHFLKEGDADLAFLARLVRKADEIREDLGSVNELFDRAAHRRLISGDDAGLVGADLDRGLAEAKGRASFEADEQTRVETKDLAVAHPEDLKRALDFTPTSLRATLETAMTTSGGPGPHLAQEDGRDTWRLRNPDLPGWREVIDREVRLDADGNGHGALPAFAFESEPFMESVGDLRVFRSRRDLQLAHLAHPLVRRALSALARYRYPGTGAGVSRWTARRGGVTEELAPGAAAVVLVSVEEFAVNRLRETFHRWVRTLAFPVRGGELGESLPGSVAQEIVAAAGESDPADRERATDLFEELVPLLKRRLKTHRYEVSEEIERLLKADREAAEKRETERYRKRFGELNSHIQSRTMGRLEREIEALDRKRQQGLLFDADRHLADLVRSKEEKQRELRRMQEDAENLRRQLRAERERILELLPQRYSVGGEVQAFPVAVEVRLPERPR